MRRIDATLPQILTSLKYCRARVDFCARDVFTFNGIELEIIDFDKDRVIDDPYADTITVMSRRIIDKRPMHNSSCGRGWIDTDLRKYLNECYLKNIPKELRDAIHPVIKTTYGSDGNAYDTNDLLFLPSESELFGSSIYSGHMEGERYAAFETSEDRVRIDKEGCERWFWSRSAAGTVSFAYALYGGRPGVSSAVDTNGVLLCFTLSSL